MTRLAIHETKPEPPQTLVVKALHDSDTFLPRRIVKRSHSHLVIGFRKAVVEALLDMRG
jgi:hypothetical protein